MSKDVLLLVMQTRRRVRKEDCYDIYHYLVIIMDANGAPTNNGPPLSSPSTNVSDAPTTVVTTSNNGADNSSCDGNNMTHNDAPSNTAPVLPQSQSQYQHQLQHQHQQANYPVVTDPADHINHENLSNSNNNDALNSESSTAPTQEMVASGAHADG